jgi:hypothetical protein
MSKGSISEKKNPMPSKRHKENEKEEEEEEGLFPKHFVKLFTYWWMKNSPFTDDNVQL